MNKSKIIWIAVPILAVIGILVLVLFPQPNVQNTVVETEKPKVIQKSKIPLHTKVNGSKPVMEQPPDNTLFGEVSYYTSDCRVKLSGEQDWKQVTESLSLHEKDSIKTGDNSEMEITLVNGDTIKIYPGTEISLAQIKNENTGGVKPSGIFLTIGKIFFKGKPNQSDFQVETQSAVAAVRGTQFTTEYTGSKMSVAVFEGTVSVSAQDKTVQVQKNEAIQVELGNAPAEKFDLPPAPDDVKIKAF